MNTATADPAGAIHVVLGTRGGRVNDVSLTSSRPTDFSRRLFRGGDVEHLLDTLPLVFSVCSVAQTQAAVRAVETAAGTAVAPAHAQAREVLVLAETAREHLFRILLGWTAWLGIAPAGSGLTALGRMRTAWSAGLYPDGDAFRPGGGRLAPDAVGLRALRRELDELVTLALGVSPTRWRELEGDDGLEAWADSVDAVAPSMVHRVISGGHAGLGISGVAALPEIGDAEIGPCLAGEAADAFVAAPEWGGVPRETTALQRQAADPLVAGLAGRYGNGVLTRQVARLVELVATVERIGALLDGLPAAEPGEAESRVSGSGVAQVEAARGRLVHRVDLDGGLITDYRILAPTEWNFHPLGGLAAGLLTLPADDALVHLAQLLVDAVDPCVESRVEVRQG